MKKSLKFGNIATSECFDKYTKDPKLYYERMNPLWNILRM